MPSHPAKLALAAASLIVAVAVWLVLRQESSTSLAATPADRQAADAKIQKHPRNDTEKPAREKAASDPATVAGMPTITLARLSPWLERAGRSPEALIAAWELTRDPALEAELAEKHASNPLVCLMLLNRPDGTIDAAWVERLRLADPNHPLPDCLAVAKAAKAGDLEAAKAALAQALTKKTPLSFREQERIAAIREAAAAAGLSPHDAAVAPSAVFTTVQANQEIVQGAFALARKATETAASGSPDEAAEQASAAITLSAFLGTNANETLMQRLGKDAVLARAAKILPPETELGNTGLTLAQALKENEKIRDITKQFDGLFLETAAPAALNAYWDQWLIGGELGAMQWALKRLGAREAGK